MEQQHPQNALSSSPEHATCAARIEQILIHQHDQNRGVLNVVARRPHTHTEKMHLSLFENGSGSSSSKLPFFSSGDRSSPSTTQSPPTELEPPSKLVASSMGDLALKLIDIATFMPSASLCSADSGAESPDPFQPSTKWEDHVGPTRASIRAWAKATPAGAPGNRVSPGLCVMPRSNSDDNLSRASLTRSARPVSATPEGSITQASRGSEDENPRRFVEREGSLGNVADGESSNSDQASRSPPSSSPSPQDAALNAQRELRAPHPHPTSPSRVSPPIAQPQPHSAHASRHVRFTQAPMSPHEPPRPAPYAESSSDSISVPAHTPAHPDQPERAERRHHHHHHNCSRHHTHHRRRHRDRDKNRPGADPSTNPPSAPRPGPITYHLVPLRPLPPPPPPLPPLRVSPAGGENCEGGTTDMLAEIVRMIKGTRAPLLRTGGAIDENYWHVNGDGWIPFPSAASGSGQGTGRSSVSGSGLGSGSRQVMKENDVLDDIRSMIQLSR
ncbi:hypothetical protein BC628DRAFT_475317 [Trametes gibbosa]|nr:hypothetical protein BC628DRAFT_475317 [Trametes gibbosa]